MKFYRVIDETVDQAIRDYFERHQSAFDAMLRFSRRHGGSRSKLGIVHSWGRIRVAINFPKEPDREIWKKSHRDSNEFWEPKASKAAKAVREEFEALEKAFPSRWDVYGLLKYEPMANGFFNFQSYGDTSVVGLGDNYKLTKPQQKQLKRISDLEYEELLTRANT